MKILYVSLIEQNAGWGAEYFMNRGFMKNGHTTVTVDYRVHEHNMSRQLVGLPDDIDAFLLQRGDHFPIPLLQAVNRPRFFWASELFARCRDQDRLFRCNLFDHVFVRTPACIAAITDKGWLPRDRISVLLSGFDEQVHFKMPHVRQDIDILFVGAMLPRRRAILDMLRTQFNVVEASAFGILLEASASEHAARRRAMKAATENADELTRVLSRQANQARQAEITTEISEIVGGAEALTRG